MTPRFELAGVRDTFRAVVRATVPAAQTLDEDGWGRLESVVQEAVGPRPASVHRQVGAFLRIVDLVSLLRTGRRLAGLSPEEATRFLERFERSFFLLLRRGVWGLRTLAFMGYYGVPENRTPVRYRAARAGWRERGTDAGPWPERGTAGPPEDHVLVAEGSAPGA